MNHTSSTALSVSNPWGVVPSLGNLDTAFQGMNTWHSFQYLALTWYINRIRIEKGEMHALSIVKRVSQAGAARSYYLLMVGFTVGTVAVGALIFVVLRFGASMSVSAALLPLDALLSRSLPLHPTAGHAQRPGRGPGRLKDR